MYRYINIYFKVIVTSLFCLFSSAYADASIRVVTTLSTFADLTETIGGEYVRVSYIASPKFNPHFIEPRPSDVMKVKRADLFVHAGLDLELWRGPLLNAAGNRKVRSGADGELDLSKGIRLLEVPDRAITRAEGDIHLYGNPHYWMDPRNAKIMVQSISKKLSELDPLHRAFYEKNMKLYLTRLDDNIFEWQKRVQLHQGKKLVAYHNQWIYLMEFIGFRIDHFLEPKPGIPPTPKHVEFIMHYIKNSGIQGIIKASYSPERVAKSIAKKTGIQILDLCQNVNEAPEASDYISMIEYNINVILEKIRK